MVRLMWRRIGFMPLKMLKKRNTRRKSDVRLTSERVRDGYRWQGCVNVIGFRRRKRPESSVGIRRIYSEKG